MGYFLTPPKPSIVQRAKVAWRVFQKGFPARRGQGRKSAPFSWAEWRVNKPQWHLVDFETYAREGFNQNALIYGAIMYKVRALSQAPLRAYAGDWDHPELLDDDHPLSMLVARPNPYMGWRQMQGVSDVYLNLEGNSYHLLIRPDRDEEEVDRGGLPKAIYPLRPDRVFIVPRAIGKRQNRAAAELLGYLYVPEGRQAFGGWSIEERVGRIREGKILPILPQDMMHVKLPNPLDPLEGLGYGLPPMSSLARSADVDNQVTQFLETFFERGTMLGGLLKFDYELQDDEVARVRERWREIYGGSHNWSEVGVLDQSGEYQQMGMNFSEMGFESIDERNEARILGPFGVPPILIGTRIGLMRSTYSNYEQARSAFWEDTFVPELTLFGDEYRYYLQSEDGAFVRHDFTAVPALQEDVLKLVEGAQKLFGMGVPSNQALSAVGLDRVGPVPGGNVGYLPMALIPSGANPPSDGGGGGGGGPEAEDEAKFVVMLGQALQARIRAIEGKTQAQNWMRQHKDQIAEEVDQVAVAWEGRYGDAAWQQFEHDRRWVLARLEQKKKRLTASRR